MKTFPTFFLKNLMSFLFPTLIPLSILGALLITVVQSYIKHEINAYNIHLLDQAKINLELALNELDTLNLYIITNPAIYMTLRDLLKAEKYTREQINQLYTIRNFLDAPAGAKPYIHSIYVYFNNDKGRFLAPASSRDVYSYIVQGIITAFIEHHYLTVQLSEKKYKLQAMELLALQSQINPHFLFNTLETIYWKAMRLTGGPNDINHMLESLSDILKYSLRNDGSLVNLSAEIAHAVNYVNIQKIRYENKFQFTIQYDGESDDVQVIKLLLQPLIENALYHGILETNRPGSIKLKILRRGRHLTISVIDDGAGMPREQLMNIRNMLNDAAEEFTAHIGLANTNRRLKLTYGEAYGIRLYSKPNFGTVARIQIQMG